MGLVRPSTKIYNLKKIEEKKKEEKQKNKKNK